MLTLALEQPLQALTMSKVATYISVSPAFDAANCVTAAGAGALTGGAVGGAGAVPIGAGARSCWSDGGWRGGWRGDEHKNWCWYLRMVPHEIKRTARNS